MPLYSLHRSRVPLLERPGNSCHFIFFVQHPNQYETEKFTMFPCLLLQVTTQPIQQHSGPCHRKWLNRSVMQHTCGVNVGMGSNPVSRTTRDTHNLFVYPFVILFKCIRPRGWGTDFEWRGWSKDFLGFEMFDSGIFWCRKIWLVFFLSGLI